MHVTHGFRMKISAMKATDYHRENFSPSVIIEENMQFENSDCEASFSTSQILEVEEESVVQTIDSNAETASTIHNCCSHCEQLRAQLETPLHQKQESKFWTV